MEIRGRLVTARLRGRGRELERRLLMDSGDFFLDVETYCIDYCNCVLITTTKHQHSRKPCHTIRPNHRYIPRRQCSSPNCRNATLESLSKQQKHSCTKLSSQPKGVYDVLPLGISSRTALNGLSLSRSTSLPLRLRLPTISLDPRTTGARSGLLGLAGRISGLAPPMTGVPPISTLPGRGSGMRC